MKFKAVIGWLLNFFEVKSKNLKTQYLSYHYNKILNISEKNIRFNGVCHITGGKKVTIHGNVHIGDNAYIRGEGGLTIGENTHISRNLVVYTHNHNYQGVCLPYDDSFVFKPVFIDRNVWIGMNVIVLPGTIIEEGAIIGAGCVVSGHIKKHSVMVSQRPFHLKNRDIEHYQKLEDNQLYGGINGKPLT